MALAPQPETVARDGYISIRRSDMAAALQDAGGARDARLADVVKMLSAILHYEAHDDLERLKTLYDPLDPDTPPARRDTSVAAFERFEVALMAALKRANYAEIPHASFESRRATAMLTGLNIKASDAGIRSIRFFARGERTQTLDRRAWLGLKRIALDANVFEDVIVVVGFKSESEIGDADKSAFSRMRRGVRPGAALVKHFRNVAHAELVTLHPGARPGMRPSDQVFLAAPAIAGGVPVLINLWPALTVLFAVLAAYFGARGAIDDSDLKRALAAISGLAAVGAFVMRQRMKFEAQTLRYQKQLAETVYFRNIANNAGVLDLLVGEGEDQDVKEALLAYWTLLKAGRTLNKAELDKAAESFLSETFHLAIDFEIGDALAKLERLGLVTQDGETYRAISTNEALAKLDAAWDSYFKFSAPTPAG
ncbi:MAG TPA: DUF3754 domain-containing protein [Caulobacterales bacterium]|nr:DUF3754 domain-containing protein [Caulobacterales bacterium]